MSFVFFSSRIYHLFAIHWYRKGLQNGKSYFLPHSRLIGNGLAPKPVCLAQVPGFQSTRMGHPRVWYSVWFCSVPLCSLFSNYTFRLVYAYDLDIISTRRHAVSSAQRCLDLLFVKCCRFGLWISAAKSRAMALRSDIQGIRLHVLGLGLEWVAIFQYLAEVGSEWGCQDHFGCPQVDESSNLHMEAYLHPLL